MDLSMCSFQDIHDQMYSTDLPESISKTLYAQYPAFTEAYHYEVLLSFLESKGLIDEFSEFKNSDEKLKQHFNVQRFNGIYIDNVEGLEIAYNRLAGQLLLSVK